MFKMLFYLKTWNQCFGEQTAGVFTLNMKPLPSCVCEAHSLFFPASLGVAIYYLQLPRCSTPPPPAPSRQISSSPPLLLSTLFAIICQLLLHPQKYRGPHKALLLPFPPQWCPDHRDQVEVIVPPERRFLRASHVNISAHLGKENGGGGASSSGGG